MSTLTVYTKPACVQCTATFRALDKAGVHYQTIDITTDAEARDYVIALGYLFSCRFENVSSMLGDGQQRPRRDTPILDTATPRRSFSALGYLFSCRFENVSSMLGDGQQRPRRDTPILDTATPRRSFSAPPQRDRRRVVMSLQSLCRALPSESHAAG
ncbi:hypothetical protein H7J52_23245 [Mycobacterium gordonae]|nr:hypothetical protein [Mycobacterium gordonae]